VRAKASPEYRTDTAASTAAIGGSNGERQATLLEQTQVSQEELRKRLILTDRMATVGTLAAGMGHEINNPLASINANISLLSERLQEIEGCVPAETLTELTELTQDAIEGAHQIRDIVQALQQFSQASTGRTELLELNPLVSRTVKMVCAEIQKRAVLTQDYGMTPPVEAEEAKLCQVILNLVVNALQSIEPTGSGKNEIAIRTYSDFRGWAVLEVSDTGKGIPDDVLERVFEPFYTTKPTDLGTGIGLSICHTVISRLGGSIEVESEVSEGTLVRVNLPPMADTEVMVEERES